MNRRIAAGLYVLCAACAGADEPSELDRNALTGTEQLAPDELTQRWLQRLPKKPGKPWHGWYPRPRHPRDHDCEEPTQPEPPARCGWQPFSEGLTGANVTDVLFDPRVRGTVYAAAGSVLWKSQDSGLSWHQHAVLEQGGFTHLVPDGADAQQLIASTTSGVVRSRDGGKSWTQIALGGLALNTLDSSPVEPRRVYVASSNAGVFRSDDGGNSFGPPGFAYPGGITTGLSVSPDDPLELVASVWDIGETGGSIYSGSLQHSSDGGATWTTALDLPDGEGGGLARCPLDPNVLIAATGLGVARSTDGGASWQLQALDGAGRRASGVAFSPTSCDTFYALQYLAGPRLTTDGGQTFGPPLVEGVEVGRVGSFPGLLRVDPNDASRLVLATHGGLFVSTDGGAHYAAASGIRDFIVTGLASSPLEPARLWLSSWGPGVWTRASSSEPWQRLTRAQLDGDYGISVGPDPYTAGRTLVGGTYVWRSNDANPSQFERVSTELNATTFAFDPVDKDVLYVGTQVAGLMRSADGGRTLAPANGNLQPWVTPNGVFIDVRDVHVAADDSATLFLATFGRGIFKSSDTGASWTRTYAEDAETYCVVGDAEDPGTLYACAHGVQRSDDGGESWRDDSAGLPTLLVRGLIQDPDTGTLYATSGSGVFQRRPGGSWQGVDTDCLPAAGTPTLTREGGKRYLVVSAGAGVYRRAL